MGRKRLGIASAALIGLTLTVGASASSQRATARETRTARDAFDALRGITGTWAFTSGADGGLVSYELVSNGTAILERVMSAEHGAAGMVSVIHLDGDRLVLAHYCGDGNQPRLVARGLVDGEIRFAFDGVTNLPSPAAGHIRGAVFRLGADGGFETEWVWRAAGVDETIVRRHARATN